MIWIASSTLAKAVLLSAVVQFDRLCILLQAWWLHSIVSLIQSRLPSAGDRTTGILWFLAQLIAAGMLLPKLTETKMRTLCSHLVKSLFLRPVYLNRCLSPLLSMVSPSSRWAVNLDAILVMSARSCSALRALSTAAWSSVCWVTVFCWARTPFCISRKTVLVANMVCACSCGSAMTAVVVVLLELLELPFACLRRCCDYCCSQSPELSTHNGRFELVEAAEHGGFGDLVGLFCVVGNSNKLAEVAGSLDLLPANVWSEELFLVWRPVRKTDRDLLDDGLLDDLGRVHLNSVGLERALRKRELLHDVASIEAPRTSPSRSASNDAPLPC